jgi:hypothetical protein
LGLLIHHECLIHVAAAAAQADVLRCLIVAAEEAGAAEASSTAADTAAAADAAEDMVNSRNARGQTPLMLAASAPGGADCVRLLLAAGADPWATDCCGGRTALFYATCADAAESAALLLAATDGQTLPAPAFPNGPATAYVDVRMLAGFTPLHVAVVANALVVLRMLLGASPRLVTPTLFPSHDFIACPRGTCPIHLAAKHNRVEAAKMIMLAFVSPAPAGGGPRAGSLDHKGRTQLDSEKQRRTAAAPPPSNLHQPVNQPTNRSSPAARARAPSPSTPAYCWTTTTVCPASWQPPTATPSSPSCCSRACRCRPRSTRRPTSTSRARRP